MQSFVALAYGTPTSTYGFNTQLSAESERKSLREQVESEKRISAEQQANFEREIDRCCKENDDMKGEMQMVALEKVR